MIELKKPDREPDFTVKFPDDVSGTKVLMFWCTNGSFAEMVYTGEDWVPDSLSKAKMTEDDLMFKHPGDNRWSCWKEPFLSPLLESYKKFIESVEEVLLGER